MEHVIREQVSWFTRIRTVTMKTATQRLIQKENERFSNSYQSVYFLVYMLTIRVCFRQIFVIGLYSNSIRRFSNASGLSCQNSFLFSVVIVVPDLGFLFWV